MKTKQLKFSVYRNPQAGNISSVGWNIEEK